VKGYQQSAIRGRPDCQGMEASAFGDTGALRLARKVGQLLAAKSVVRNTDGSPACAFGLIVDERLEGMRQDLADLRGMTRWLFFLVFSTFVSVVAQVLLGGG